MAEPPGSTGVCIIRVWRQGGTLAVRLHGRDDIDEPDTEWRVAAVGVDAAVELVRSFLLRSLPDAEQVAGRAGGR